MCQNRMSTLKKGTELFAIGIQFNTKCIPSFSRIIVKWNTNLTEKHEKSMRLLDRAALLRESKA